MFGTRQYRARLELPIAQISRRVFGGEEHPSQMELTTLNGRSKSAGLASPRDITMSDEAAGHVQSSRYFNQRRTSNIVPLKCALGRKLFCLSLDRPNLRARYEQILRGIHPARARTSDQRGSPSRRRRRRGSSRRSHAFPLAGRLPQMRAATSCGTGWRC